MRSASPDCPFAPQLATVPVEWGHTNESGDLLAVQQPQLGQAAEERGGDGAANAGDALEYRRLRLQPGSDWIKPSISFSIRLTSSSSQRRCSWMRSAVRGAVRSRFRSATIVSPSPSAISPSPAPHTPPNLILNTTLSA